jgi:hypothetical protein
MKDLIDIFAWFFPLLIGGVRPCHHADRLWQAPGLPEELVRPDRRLESSCQP